MFLWTIIKRTIGIGIIVLGLFLYGMKGLLGGVVIQNTFAYFVNIGLVSRFIGYKWHEQIKDFLPVGIVALIAALISYGIGMLTKQPIYIDALIKLMVYLLVYLGWSFLFKPEAYRFFVSIIPIKLHFWERHRK